MRRRGGPASPRSRRKRPRTGERPGRLARRRGGGGLRLGLGLGLGRRLRSLGRLGRLGRLARLAAARLTAPGEGEGVRKPPSDEFGRDDPASLERERRRREREARRSKSRESPEPSKAAQAPEPPPEPEPEPEPESAAAAPPSEAPPGRSPVRGRFRRDRGEAGPPRRRIFSGPKQHRTYRRRRILALALLLVGALVVWFLIAFFQPPPFDPGNGSGEAIVTVTQGASASEVADLLTENDVGPNGTLFEWRLKLAGKTGDILPGRYVLAHNMSYGTAIDRLTSSGGKINGYDPRGGGPHPDRRDHQGPRAERRLHGREQELQGLRPEQVRRPDRSPSRDSSSRPPTSSIRGRASISSSRTSCRPSSRTSPA